MKSLSSKNQSVKYLFCAIDVFTKYAWIKPLKNKKVYSTHKKGKSIAAEKFIKTLKGKIYKQMTANDSKSYFSGFLNELVDEYNNTYHRSIGKKPIDADYSALTEKIESSHKTPKFKVGDRLMIIKYKGIFSKGYPENWSRKIFNMWTYKIKDLNGEKNSGKFL